MRRGLRNVPTLDIPDWAIGESKDAANLVAAFALVEPETHRGWFKLSAETQRKILGFPVFGKHTIHWDGEVFRVNHSAVGGGYTDSFTPAEVTAAARAGTKL